MLFRPRDRRQFPAREALDEPRLQTRRLVLCLSRVPGAGGEVRTRHSARLGELDEPADIDARRRSDLIEGLRNRRGDVLDVNACQPSREGHGELHDLFELAVQEASVTTTG